MSEPLGWFGTESPFLHEPCFERTVKYVNAKLDCRMGLVRKICISGPYERHNLPRTLLAHAHPVSIGKLIHDLGHSRTVQRCITRAKSDIPVHATPAEHCAAQQNDHRQDCVVKLHTGIISIHDCLDKREFGKVSTYFPMLFGTLITIVLMLALTGFSMFVGLFNTTLGRVRIRDSRLRVVHDGEQIRRSFTVLAIHWPLFPEGAVRRRLQVGNIPLKAQEMDNFRRFN